MASGGTYENFEHTADLGLHIYGRDLKELLETACEALCAQLTDPAAVACSGSVELSLEAGGGDELLRVWLAELLLLFNERRWLARSAQVDLQESFRLRAVVSGEEFEPARHEIIAEIKAVTWHLLAVDEMENGILRGTVVLDI